MGRKKNISESLIIDHYMEFVLETGKQPESIFAFCKSLNIDEPSFYKFFNSFEQLEKEIYSTLFTITVQTLEKSDEFKHYGVKEKLLSLYFTFIENLTNNRSFVLLTINKSNPIENLTVLKKLKAVFGDFVSTLNFETIDFKQESINKIQEKSYEEFLWVQLLLIIKFWISDESKGFEKTDIFIEKTVHASFDLMNTKPIKSFMDLGKFLLKEKMNFKM